MNQVQFSYNDFGQSIQTFQEHGGTVNTGTTPSVQRGYANGSTNTVRPLSLTYPNGRELAYDYGTTNEINDALSRIGSIVDDDTTHLADYEFLGLAGVIQQTSPQPHLRYTLAGVSNDPDTGDIYTGLDRFGRVKDSRWYNTSTNDDLSRIQYGYDRASNRIWRKNPVATANSAEYDWLYTYDGLQRLKTAHRGTLNGTQTALTSTAFKQDWNLDPTGNWEGFKQSDNGSTWSMEQARTANPVNEITDITNTVGTPWADPAYNAVGNMTTIPKPKQMDEAYTATYDAWNRLVKLEEEVSSTLETVAEYQYDARNFRVIVKNFDYGVLDETTHAYFTDGWQNIEERTDSNSTTSQHHIWGLRYVDDCLLRDRTTDDTVDERLYALQDANWNVTTIADVNGEVQERFEYNSYGPAHTLSVSFASLDAGRKWKVTYCGYMYDIKTEWHYVRHRFHQPKTGAWTLQDPMRYAAGINIYEYVRSNPHSLIDPTGLEGKRIITNVDEWYDQWKRDNPGHSKTWYRDERNNLKHSGCVGISTLLLGYRQMGDKGGPPYSWRIANCYLTLTEAKTEQQRMIDNCECSGSYNPYGESAAPRIIGILLRYPGGQRQIPITSSGKCNLSKWNGQGVTTDAIPFDFGYYLDDKETFLHANRSEDPTDTIPMLVYESDEESFRSGISSSNLNSAVFCVMCEDWYRGEAVGFFGQKYSTRPPHLPKPAPRSQPKRSQPHPYPWFPPPSQKI